MPCVPGLTDDLDGTTAISQYILMDRSEFNIALAFGANLPSRAGGRCDTIRAALKSLTHMGIEIARLSPFYASEAVPAGSGPDFVNGAALLRSNLSVRDILDRFHLVEREFGRTRKSRWAPRPLDFDLIFAGDIVSPDAETQTAWRTDPEAQEGRRAPGGLILPHPRMQDRAFVLIPLADIAPDWCHPVLGLSVRQMLEARPAAERNAVKRLGQGGI